jgi:hypothetical protein
VDRAYFYLQTKFIQEFGEFAVAGLVDQDVDGIALHRQSGARQEKIPQVSAQDDHAFTLGYGRLQVFQAVDGNCGAPLLIGRLHCDNHLNTGAKKIPQSSAHNDMGIAGSGAAGQSYTQVHYRPGPITTYEQKRQACQGVGEREQPSSRQNSDGKAPDFETYEGGSVVGLFNKPPRHQTPSSKSITGIIKKASKEPNLRHFYYRRKSAASWDRTA